MSDPSQRPGADQRKLDPAELRLRSSPPAVTRLSRRALAVLAGAAGFGVIAALLYALDPPRLFRRGTGAELYNTDAKPGAEGLAGLPRDYASIPRPSTPSPVAQLGPPLPGDLGRPLLRAQAGSQPLGVPSRPDTDPDVTRRQQEVDQARRSQVFFQVARRQGSASSPARNGGEVGAADSGAARPDAATGDAELQQNMQDRKLAFLKAPVERQIYAPHRVQQPASPHQLMAGTVIAAALVTGIDSDLPGLVKAQVTESLYDSVTGRHCLVPQGSTLVGQYDSHIAFGQRRVLLVWTRLLRPDGSSIVLDRLPATDPAGQAGLEDGVDYHWGRIAAAAAVSTLLGIGSELGAGDQDRLIGALRRGGQDSFNRAGQEIVRRNLNVQPTLTLRTGLPLRVIVQRDIILPPVHGSSEEGCRS